jgi:molybdate transport system permease protein
MRLAPLAAGVATSILLAFVALPMLAIFLEVPVGTLFAQLHSKVALDALGVSLRTSVAALALILLIGTPAAYVLGTRRFRGAALISTILELPLVLPPPVAGIGLLVALGRAGLLGGTLPAIGLSIPFTQVAVVMALVFVSRPLYVRQAVASFASVDGELLAASRTLGAGPWRTFLRVGLPLARAGLSAGSALAWARALGEFGATLIFAGSFQGTTQTLSLAIYAQFSGGGRGGLDVALAMAALLVSVSAGVLVSVKVLLQRERGEVRDGWTRFSSSKSLVG